MISQGVVELPITVLFSLSEIRYRIIMLSPVEGLPRFSTKLTSLRDFMRFMIFIVVARIYVF